MSTYKVSVIISTYNTADYLEECLDSIFEQTLQGIEVVLIDDGSTDNTASIIKQYQNKYCNLISFRQENQGAGKARNYAITLSRGKYMIFMDPDDKYPCEDCLEKLYMAAEKYNMSICGGNILSNNNGIIRNLYMAGDGDVAHTKDDIISVENYFYMYGHTRYLFRTNLIKENHVEYASYCNFEDQVFTIKTLGIAGELYELNYPVYEYRIGHRQREINLNTLYDTLSGFRDTLEMIIKYNMYLMFQKNYNEFLLGYMTSIVRYAFCGNIDFDRVIEDINELVKESGWDAEGKFLITRDQIAEYSKSMTREEKKLREIISGNSSVIIYGAGKNAKKLISAYRGHLQNVIGIAVSKIEGCSELEGLPVRNIEDYVQYKVNAVVLLTPASRMKDEIIDTLKSLGFKRYEWIDVRLIEDENI